MTESPTFMLDRDYGKFTIKDRASLLRQLYKRLFLIIDACFTGYFLIADERLNLYDIKTRLIIEKILFSEDSGLIHNLCERYKRPLESLYENFQEGDIWWEDGGVKQMMLEFAGFIDETFVELGEPEYAADLVTNQFLNELDSYLIAYKRDKRAKEIQFEKNIEKAAEKFNKNPESEAELEKPIKRKLGFIKD